MAPLLIAALLIVADPKEGPTRPPLTAPMLNDLTKQKDQIAPDGLVAKLGPPDWYQHADLIKQIRYIADVQMIWEDKSLVEFRFVDNKLVAISAQYGGRPSGPRTPEAVLALKGGETREEMSKIFGSL